MKYSEFTSIHDFIDKVGPYLSKDEAKHNLPLGLLYQHQNHNQDNSQIYLSLVEKGEEILSIFVMTPPHNLIVIERKEGSIPLAVSSILQAGIQFPGVLGQKDAALSFAKEWKRQTNQELVIHMNQRIYQLEKVSPISKSTGKMRLATLNDIKLVKQWIKEFIEDTKEPAITGKHAEDLTRKKIEDKLVFLWIDNEKPVSMACRARSTKNVVVVNLVYTPREERKKGYASSVVSSLSEKLLGEFSYCALYTDLDNPTSNKIYQEIGYKPICDSVMIQFK